MCEWWGMVMCYAVVCDLCVVSGVDDNEGWWL